MEKNTLELLAIVGSILVGGSGFGLSLGTLVSYYVTSTDCKKAAQENKEFANNIARTGLEKINSREWAYRNVRELGTKLAYKRFLSKSK